MSAQGQSVTLVRDGKSDHAIVLSPTCAPSERHGAEELSRFIEEISGARLPVVTDAEAGERPMICVGESAATHRLGIAVDGSRLGSEGYVVRTVPPHLIIVGGRLRGTMYGCYSFLEDHLGCRWFTPDCSCIPRQRTIKLPALDKTYVPPLEYRATDYPNSRDGDWATRNKMNGTLVECDEAQGGKISYSHFVHTFNALIPPDEYFDTHPEYFSEINGERRREHTQLCLTNPEVLELGKRRLRQWMQEAPEATIFSVSQNDWYNYCECAECTRLAEEEGSQAGPLLHFVNALAESVEQDFPDKIVDTLAYQYTRKPPLHVKPRPNVAIRLCSIECCFTHPLDTCPENASFVEDIRGWHRICNRLHIWDYVIDYAHCVMPFPNLRVLRPNISFFINNGVTGIYEEANYFSKGGELAELRTYVMAKTLWDPSYDTDTAINEFLEGYYGPAAGPLRRYLDLTHDKVERDQVHLRIFDPPTAGHLPPELVAQAEALLGEAERAVQGDPALLHRAQVAHLPIRYVQILAAQGGYRKVGSRFVPQQVPHIGAMLDQFEATAKAEGLTHLREWRAELDQWLAAMRSRGEALEVVTLRSPALRVQIIPARGGRLFSVRDLRLRRELLVQSGPADPLFPGTDGYEEYSGSGYRSPGWEEAYAVVEQSERRAVLEAKLDGGLTLRRAVDVAVDEAVVTVTSTLTNSSDAEKPACLRTHPELAVRDAARARVEVRRADGSWQRHGLGGEAEQDVWLRGGGLPDGAWRVVDEAGRVVIENTFGPGQVAQGLLNWDGKRGRVNLELYSPERKLAPGESLTITQTFRSARLGERG